VGLIDFHVEESHEANEPDVTQLHVTTEHATVKPWHVEQAHQTGDDDTQKEHKRHYKTIEKEIEVVQKQVTFPVFKHKRVVVFAALMHKTVFR
jgi:hypothetical protein